MADEMEGQTFEQEEDEALKFMEEQQRKKEEKLQDEMEDYQESRKHEKQAMENEIEELKRKKIERAKQREEDEKRMALQRREEEIKRKAEEEERKKRKAAEEEKRKKERERKRRENERMKEKSKGPNFTIVKKEGGDKKVEEEEKKPPQKTKEQLEKEKQAALSTRITALNEDLQGTEALAEYAKELHNQIRNLVSNMYNLEDTYKRHQYDIVELQERARAMSKTKKRGVASVQYDDSYDRMNDRFSNAPQKAYKRGMSAKKLKRKRDYTSMKAIGVKSIDETFKVAIQPLRDGTDLRDNVQIALAEFKETCGLSPIANLKQCVRLLATRVQSSTGHASLRIYMKGDYPCLDADGNLPDILKKALLTFDNGGRVSGADLVYERLIQSQRAGLEWHEELGSISVQAGLKGKKLTKAAENFAWNIRVLQGQADLLLQAKKECREYLRQMNKDSSYMCVH